MSRWSRRGAILGVFSLASACALFGGKGGGGVAGVASGPQYTQAFGVAMFGHSGEDNTLTQWTQTMYVVKYDVIPFLRAVRDAKRNPRLGMIYEPYPGSDVMVHKWVILDRKGKPTKKIGEAAIDHVVKKTKLSADDMRICGYGLGTIPTQLVLINAFATGMRGKVDSLLYAREVEWPKMMEGGHLSRANYEKMLPDVDLALRVSARYHDSMQEARMEVMVVLALATQYMQEGALEELEGLADEVIERGKHVLPYPSTEDFGIAANPNANQTFLQMAYTNAWYRTNPRKYQYPGGRESKVPAIASAPVMPAPGVGGSSPAPAPVAGAPAAATPKIPTSEAELEAAGIGLAGRFLDSLPVNADGMIEDYQRGKEIAGAVMEGASAAATGNIGGVVTAASKFLPPDHIVGVSLSTIGSAMRGDIRGVISGVGKMTKNSKVMQRMQARLGKFSALEPLVAAGV
jgi:hypothetical protein